MHEGHHHTNAGDEAAFETLEQALALMSYMLEHNRHHAEELHELCHKLEAMGKGDAANLLEAGVDKFRDGNAMLESALDTLKGE